MGLFSNLLETYNKCSLTTGIVQTDEQNNRDDRKTFLPIFHITYKSQVCVTIDGNGNFIDVSRDNKDQTIIIPCSEKSASRSSGIAPHPLCDQLAYVDKGLVKEKFNAYITQLNGSKGDNVKINAIYTYLSNNSIAEAMIDADLFKDSEYKEAEENGENSNRMLDLDKISKIGVRFSVQVKGDMTPNVWEDNELRDWWIKLQNENVSDVEGFDYLSGGVLTQIARTHPKNINSMTGNAKLISCNDSSEFTFRGRFTEQDEAVQIDAISSQKAHQTLKWLINNYGVHTGNQVVVIWAVDDVTEERIKPFGNSYETAKEAGEDEDIQSDNDKLTEASTRIDGNYSRKIAKTLRGFAKGESIKEHNKKIVIVIFDAATTGRMSITFYREFLRDEYYENIAKWHEEAAWHLTAFKKEKVKDAKGKEKEVIKAVKYTGCPSFKDILTAAYGKPRSGNDKAYNTLKKNIQKQLLECMFGNFVLPKSLMDAAMARVSKPMAFTDENNSFKELQWRYSLDVACSLARKYYIQENKKQKKQEDISMELEPNRTDRDYLYGRLLSVADRLESYALYQANKSENQERATNAVRLMTSFAAKPSSMWRILWIDYLQPYKDQLRGASYYQKIIDDIMVLFKDGEFEDNKSLSSLCLLGYSAQNRAFSNKSKENKEGNNNVVTE